MTTLSFGGEKMDENSRWSRLELRKSGIKRGNRAMT